MSSQNLKICPRCQHLGLSPDADGDDHCFLCGHIRYGTGPAAAAIEISERDQDILAARLRGDSFGTIGKRYGISRQRAHQICGEAWCAPAPEGVR